MPSQQRQTIQYWCDSEEPQHIPGDREFIVIDEGSLQTLHPIGETTLYTRRGYANVLLLSAQEQGRPYTPQHAHYRYVGMFYETAANGLQLWKQQLEQAKIQNLRSDGPRTEETYDVPELDLWKEYVEQQDREREGERWNDRTPWEILEEERRGEILWLCGKEIDLREERKNPCREEHPYDLQRRRILDTPRLSNHIEPLLLRDVTARRVFLLLSDTPYSYASIY